MTARVGLHSGGRMYTFVHNDDRYAFIRDCYAVLSALYPWAEAELRECPDKSQHFHHQIWVGSGSESRTISTVESLGTWIVTVARSIDDRERFAMTELTLRIARCEAMESVIQNWKRIDVMRHVIARVSLGPLQSRIAAIIDGPG